MKPIPYKLKRILTLIALVILLPVYIIVVVGFLESADDRLHWFLEILLYLFFGLVWIFPLRYIVSGVGKADPKTIKETEKNS